MHRSYSTDCLEARRSALVAEQRRLRVEELAVTAVLDVVLSPGGHSIITDVDELDRALARIRAGPVTAAEAA